MKKCLLAAISFFVFLACETPNVTEGKGDIQKEVLNRSVRQISSEEEELFGFEYSAQILEDFDETEIQEDSINSIKGHRIEFVDTIKKETHLEFVSEIIGMFSYDLERGIIPTNQPAYIDKNVKRPFYYNTKVITEDSVYSGFWLIKIDAAAVRRNMPEK